MGASITYSLLSLELGLHVLLGDIGLLVPDVLLSRLVNLRELLFRRPDLVGSLLRRVRGDVFEEDGGVAHWNYQYSDPRKGMMKHTDLAKFAIGDQKRSQGLEALQRLLAILLAGLLVDGNRCLHISRGDLLGLPDELLQQFTLVLGQEQLLGLVDNIAQVPDQNLALGGQLVRRGGEGLGRQGTVQGDIALFVLFKGDVLSQFRVKRAFAIATYRRKLAVFEGYEATYE